MKQIRFLILALLLITICFLSNSFAQDYVHYDTLTGHRGYVYSVAFSPDGRTLASGGVDKTIRLWDVVTGEYKIVITGHTDEVSDVAFSPDGQTLASGSSDDTVRLWNVTTGKHKKTLTGHTSSISISFSPDGRILASASGKEIRLWDVATGENTHKLTGHEGIVMQVSFSPDRQTLASASWGEDANIRLWDVATGENTHKLTGHTFSVWSISFTPDGQMLASSGSDKTICLWDVAAGRYRKTLTRDTGIAVRISFSPDGQTLAASHSAIAKSPSIHLWDVATGKHKKTLTKPTSSVGSIAFAFSPDGRMIASGSGEVIYLWRIHSPQSAAQNPQSTANEVYDSTIRSVMWMVNPGIGEGSGVLFDKKFKLAVTNAHVTSEQNTIDVYFPAPDEKGELIKDRNFYLTNNGVLKRLGYYTKGHVVARNEETDLAIIRLDGLPETAREINWNSTAPATDTSDLVYILGNPGGQDLWRWTLGEFLKDHGDFLHIQSDVFGGNSGGPVLNKQGVLLGIVARSDRHMNALAIPVRHISGLLSKSQLEHSRSRR